MRRPAETGATATAPRSPSWSPPGVLSPDAQRPPRGRSSMCRGRAPEGRASGGALLLATLLAGPAQLAALLLGGAAPDAASPGWWTRRTRGRGPARRRCGRRPWRGDLLEGRAGGADREEQVGIGVPALGELAPFVSFERDRDRAGRGQGHGASRWVRVVRRTRTPNCDGVHMPLRSSMGLAGPVDQSNVETRPSQGFLRKVSRDVVHRHASDTHLRSSTATAARPPMRPRTPSRPSPWPGRRGGRRRARRAPVR